MSPLVIGFKESNSDNAIFVTAFKAFFKDEVSTHQQIGVCNISKLKITIPIKGRQPHI